MAVPDEPRKLRLTVFLIKDGYNKIEDFLTFDGFETIKVGKNPDETGFLIYKGGFKSEPSWVAIFKDLPGFKSHLIRNQSSKALYVTQHEGRWFCFTFGYARHLIDDLAYERNFGLIVALNLGDPAAIKSIDKTNIGHISLHSKEQATREIELSNFEFDTDIDLLKSITAKSPPVQGEDQEIFSGRDSVTISTRVTVDSFRDIAKRLYKAYSSKQYKKRYPWIDKIREERDTSVIEKLDEALVAGILNKDFSQVWLAVPEVVQWEHINGFAFRLATEGPKKPGPVLYQDLDIDEWVNVSKIDKSLSVKQLKAKKIFIYWNDGRPSSSWTVYRCLNAELDLNGKKYILNDGDWYNIESNFVTEVTKFYQSVADSKIKLPNFGGQSEPIYLQSVVAASTGFALMDRKEVMIGGGRSRVEFCDLYSNSNQIIHIKKYGGAGLLSHLFAQAVVSADSFLNDPDFRVALNKLLPKGFKIGNPSVRPTAAEYEVCVGIMSKVPGPLELPFFSKVSFKYAVKTLTNLGYSVTKLKIEI